MRLSFEQFNVLAVVLGLMVDWVGSLLSGLVYWVAVRGWLSFRGVAEAEATRLLETPDLWPWTFQVVLLAIGLFWTMGGGFAAARAAKRQEVAHAGAVGLISCLLGLVASVGTPPSWWFAIGSALTPPVAVLGGYLARSMTGTTEAQRG